MLATRKSGMMRWATLMRSRSGLRRPRRRRFAWDTKFSQPDGSTRRRAMRTSPLTDRGQEIHCPFQPYFAIVWTREPLHRQGSENSLRIDLLTQSKRCLQVSSHDRAINAKLCCTVVLLMHTPLDYYSHHVVGQHRQNCARVATPRRNNDGHIHLT